MEKISAAILAQRRTIQPVIVEAEQYESVRNLLRDRVPRELLAPRFGTFLPRVRPLIEFPMAGWKEIPGFKMIAAPLTMNAIEELAQVSGVRRIYSDPFVWALSARPEAVFFDVYGAPFTSTFWTKKALGLDRATQKGYTGRGVRVSTVDSGARSSHPQLRGVTTMTAIPEKGGSGEDGSGHGTHVASTIGGVYAIDRRYTAPCEGMAPEAAITSIQALGFIIGVGTASDIIKGMEIARGIGSKVVNMSLGSEEKMRAEEDAQCAAIKQMVSEGVISVAAAGNSGPAPGTISSPGRCEGSLTVGSYSTLTGKISPWSSRGPTIDELVKPDVSAPGERIDSALVGYLDASLDKSQPKYGILDGTSMACPHVSGLVACMAQLYSEKVGIELTVNEVKRMMNARANGVKGNDEGWGRIDWPTVEWWVDTEYGAKA